jgi:aerobic carbon-monoxide dehydrogenase medium subunit
LTQVDFCAAASVDEARALLDEYGEDARIVNGGTALAILMRQDLIRPKLLVGIGGIVELQGIEEGEDGGLRIGAAVKLRVAERNELLRSRWPMVAEAIAAVATPRIRNMATVGGGLAHADPAQDPPVAYCAAGASVVVRGKKTRRIPAADFCTGYYENALEPGEIVTAIELPAPKPHTGGAFLKFLPRSAEDYGVVTAAASVTLGDDGRWIEARLALGACAERPIVVDATAGRADAAELVRDLVDPIDDVRGSAAYKREMAVVFARRALLAAAARA